MHDDDWFTGPESLQVFADTIFDGKALSIFQPIPMFTRMAAQKVLPLNSDQLTSIKHLPEITICIKSGWSAQCGHF